MGIPMEQIRQAERDLRAIEQTDILRLTAEAARLRADLHQAFFHLDYLSRALYLREDELRSAAKRAAQDVQASLEKYRVKS